MKRKVMFVSLLSMFLMTTASVEAATTVVSTVDTKSGVRFHGENPNPGSNNGENGGNGEGNGSGGNTGGGSGNGWLGGGSGNGSNNYPNGAYPGGGNGSGSTGNGKLPQTGETQNSGLYVLLGSLVTIGAMFTIAFKFKNKKNEGRAK